MGKPILILDNDFINDIYGRPADATSPVTFDKAVGEAVLDSLLKKYDVRVTRTIINEASGDAVRAPVRDWFNAHQSDITIYETSGFTGPNKGERSIASLFDPASPFYDPNLPKDPAQVRFATRDQKFFGKQSKGWKPFTMSTQEVLETGLADGTIPPEAYKGVERVSGDAFKTRGGLKTVEQVYAEHGVTPPPATVEPPQATTPAGEQQTQPKPEPASKTAAPPVPEAPPVEVKAPTPPPPQIPPGAVLAEAATMTGSKFAAPKTEAPAPVTAHPGVGNAGAAGVGLVLGVEGLNDAIHRGDKVEGVIAGTNVATSGLQATESILAASGKTLPALTNAGRFIPGVNLAVTAVDGVYQISKEDTVEHKVERGTVVAATATTGIVLGTATATVAEAGVITTGVTTVLGTGAAGLGTAAVVTAAAPVVLTVAAVGAVAYTGEKAIEAKRAWDDVDRQIAEGGAAQKRQNYQSQDGKPSVLGYKHIAVAMLHHSENMKNENMNGTGGLERDANGRFKIQDFKKIDMRDPKNIAELERVLKAGLEKEDKILKDSSNVLDNVLPKWMAHGSKMLDRITMAQMERADLAGALQELQMYKKELADYDAAHPKDPATTQPPKAKAAKGPGSP